MSAQSKTSAVRWQVALAALAGVSILSACSAASSNSGSATASSPAAAGAALPARITIGYQLVPNGDLVVKNQRLLERAFGGKVTIAWKQFASGGDVNQAVLAHSVDIGLVGSSPASRGISAGIPYEVPWIFDVIGKAEALAVKPGITGLAGLKGKKIATPFASTSHYSLLAALKNAGIAESDVKIINLEPDAIVAAWKAGQIDGAYVWNPSLAELVKAGGKVLVDSAQLAARGQTTYDLAVVTTDFATRYPAAVRTWADQENVAVKEILNGDEKAFASIAAEANITPAQARAQTAGLVFLDAAHQVLASYLSGGLAANLLAEAQFNKALGKIDTVRPAGDYSKAVVAAFAAAAK